MKLHQFFGEFQPKKGDLVVTNHGKAGQATGKVSAAGNYEVRFFHHADGTTTWVPPLALYGLPNPSRVYSEAEVSAIVQNEVARTLQAEQEKHLSLLTTLIEESKPSSIGKFAYIECLANLRQRMGLPL